MTRQMRKTGEVFDRWQVPIHDDHFADPLPQPTLDQERHIDNAVLAAAQPVPEDVPQHRPAHGGMHNRIEFSSLHFVVENDGAELLPIQCAIRLKDFRAKKSGDLGKGWSTRLDNLPREYVSVDDRNVFSLEQVRNA